MSKPSLFPPQLPLWGDYPYKNKPVLWCVHHMSHFHGRSCWRVTPQQSPWGGWGDYPLPKIRPVLDSLRWPSSFSLLEGFKIHSAFILIDSYEDLRRGGIFEGADVWSGGRRQPLPKVFIDVSMETLRWQQFTFQCLQMSKFEGCQGVHSIFIFRDIYVRNLRMAL